MNKSKIIIPLMLVAPALFACNNTGGVAGNYKVQAASEIKHKFVKGEESTFQGFSETIGEIKEEIYNALITCGDKTTNIDKAVHLESEPGMPGTSATGEQLTLYAVNLKKNGESSYSEAFEYAKTKSGYHFMMNYSGSYDNYIFYSHIVTGGFGDDVYETVVDNGFKVNGKTLTLSVIGQFGATKDAISHQIEFTVTATK